MCNITKGFPDVICNDFIGGVKALYFGTFEDFGTGVTLDGTTLRVEGLASGGVFKYVPHRNSASWVEEVQASDTFNVFYLNTITLSLRELTQTKQNELYKLAQGRWVVFVQDQQDVIWMCGYEEGMRVTGGNASTGAAKGDLYGYTLTLTAESKGRAPQLEQYTTSPFDNFAGVSVTTN